MKIFKNDWADLLNSELEKPYYQELRKFLIGEYRTKEIFPNMYDIFNAFKFTHYENVKAVIIGQDPYHEPHQAHGLCFSVQKGCDIPPSLRNIYQELYNDLGIPPAPHGELTAWAKSGVLLLNTVLTVRRGAADSHKFHGWEEFTDNVTRKLNEHERPIVFILWGSKAKAKKALITNPRHLILEAGHPSPLSSRYFFGCRHFSKANEFLKKNNLKEIEW